MQILNIISLATRLDPYASEPGLFRLFDFWAQSGTACIDLYFPHIYVGQPNNDVYPDVFYLFLYREKLRMKPKLVGFLMSLNIVDRMPLMV